jgi:hypothetical protein
MTISLSWHSHIRRDIPVEASVLLVGQEVALGWFPTSPNKSHLGRRLSSTIHSLINNELRLVSRGFAGKRPEFYQEPTCSITQAVYASPSCLRYISCSYYEQSSASSVDGAAACGNRPESSQLRRPWASLLNSSPSTKQLQGKMKWHSILHSLIGSISAAFEHA